jgi:tripartite-type tricarboxylate transporter receptor subunit TctC
METEVMSISSRPSFPRLAARAAKASLPAVFALLVASAAQAGPFQGGLVTIVVPNAAGSSFDNAARAVAEPLSRMWGVPVVVENRPGAATTIGTAMAARARPDGRTILLMTTPTIQAPYLFTKLTYNPVTSFAAVAQMFDARLWLAVNTSVSAKTVRDFVALARPAGSNFSYSSPGPGSTPHLDAVQLAKKANINLLHVPYKGISPAVVDLAAGMVTATFASYSDLEPHVKTGKIRVLASTGADRSPVSRDIPTMKESGFSGFETIGFGGLVVPAATPKTLVDEMARDVNKVLATPEVKARLIFLSFEPVISTPSQFAKVIKDQSDYWKKLMTDAEVKPE